MISSVFALIASYSILLLLGPVGPERLLFLITVFLFSLFPTLLNTADTLSSGEGARVLRFLGARQGTVATAVLGAVLEAALSGALVGVILGLLLSNFVLGAPGVRDITAILTNFALVLASCTAGIFAGVAVGVGLSWKKSS